MLEENYSLDAINKETDHDGIGRIEVSTIPLPESMKPVSGTYTYSGKVLVTYKTDQDSHIKDFYNVAVLNDDGTDFRVIFTGTIPTKPKANGIRFMPFQDNKRVLLGDYVFECTPDIDTCTNIQLVPVEYPEIISEDENTTHHWSEIIIAPDNKHISWTLLRVGGAAAAIGELVRHADAYVIENSQLISTLVSFKDDPVNPGFILPQPLRGGEVKQFVRGGNAISIVGAKCNATTDSVIQDLTSEELTQITFTPGYDETTIFSPDERLGIVMSSRFSTHTDPAIFGLLPRPYGSLSSAGMMWSLYTYAITGVRNFRKGNIGPALIEIERSMNEPGYKGIQLTTDENWVYVSPMSWHPESICAMWLEMFRGSDGSQMRLQHVKLLDYEAGPAIPIVPTTDNIPYGIKDLTELNTVNPNIEGKIKGKKSGYISYIRQSSGHSGINEVEYCNFSDDGVNFYNGYEKSSFDFFSENRFEAKVQLIGPKEGEMNFRATFSAIFGSEPSKLLFAADEDGKPKSYGYATYDGVKLHIEDLLE